MSEPDPPDDLAHTRTPIPVRDMMPGRKPTPVAGESGEAPALPDVEVSFEVEGEEWTAGVGGLTRSGTAPDSGAPLLLVTFRRGSSEEEGDPPPPEREAWAVARRLDDLSRLQLEELFRRSRPFRQVDPSGGDREGGTGSAGPRAPRTTHPRGR